MKRFPKAVRAPIPFRPRDDLAKGGRPMRGVVDRKSGGLSRILGVADSEKETKKDEEVMMKKTTATKIEQKQHKGTSNRKLSKTSKNNNNAATPHPFLSGLSVYVDGVSASAYLSRPPAAGLQNNNVTPAPAAEATSEKHGKHDKHCNEKHDGHGQCSERSLYWADFISLVVIICCFIVLCLCGMYYVSNVDDRRTTLQQQNL